MTEGHSSRRTRWSEFADGGTSETDIIL
jgi:hypothetical protein